MDGSTLSSPRAALVRALPWSPEEMALAGRFLVEVEVVWAVKMESRSRDLLVLLGSEDEGGAALPLLLLIREESCVVKAREVEEEISLAALVLGRAMP